MERLAVLAVLADNHEAILDYLLFNYKLTTNEVNFLRYYLIALGIFYLSKILNFMASLLKMT